ncbi:MAG: sulfurtransferase, partial [Desulfobacteraceae bacterium]|nr:sulfurtransferase [Desulfobacteraceae bacterium]
LIAVTYVIVNNNTITFSTVDKDKYLNIDVSKFENGNEIFILPVELHKQLEQKNPSSLIVLDASNPKVYAKGHIPGALSVGFKGLSETTGKPGDKEWGVILSKKKLVEKLKSLGISNDKLVVVYSDIDKGPGAGGRAVWQLKMAGFENVRLLYGGLEVWKRLGYELSKKTSKPVPAKNLVLKDYNESFRAKQKYIFENLSNLKIVDVRSLKEYTGKDTSRGEARAGHIKGAKWLSWKSVLNEDTTVKSPEEIINLMAGIGIKPGDDFVLY